MGIDKGVDLPFKEDASTVIEVFNSMSWEDVCKVSWDKHSFAETRTEGTKEMERVILKLIRDDVNMMRDDMHEESEDSISDMDDA